MKIFNIDFSFNRALTKEYVVLLTLFITSLGLLVAIVILIQTILSQYESYMLLRDEVERIETRINLVDSYKLLSQDEIRENNRFLEELVPGNDTNLSMYYILDDLSARSTLELSNYQLSATTSQENGAQVTVSAVGTPEELIRFLDEYMFLSGRLLTLNSIEIRRETYESTELNIKMIFNYYTIEIRSVSKVQNTVSQNDIEFLRNIRKNIQDLRETGQ